MFSSSGDVIAALLRATFLAGKTNIAGAFRQLIDQSFTASVGGRSTVPHVVIFFTDGKSTVNVDQTVPYAIEALNKGDCKYTVLIILLHLDPNTVGHQLLFFSHICFI